MALQLVITNAGRAAIADQANGGFRAVRIAAIGVSPNAIAAAPNASTLPGEVKRITSIAGEATAVDVVHLTVTDESDATYTVRSFALYLNDGTLFALYGQNDVIVEKSAQALLLLAIDVTLSAIPAAAITFGNANFTNPAATTDRAGVVELATDAEAAAMTDRARGLTPAGLGAAFTPATVLARLLMVDGAGSGLDADLVDGRHVGTSGDAIPSLAGINSWSGRQTFGEALRIVATVPVGAQVGGWEAYSAGPVNGWFAGTRSFVPAGASGIDSVDLRFYTCASTSAERMRITPGGWLGIGTTAPTSRLHVDGVATTTGGYRVIAAVAVGAQVGGWDAYSADPVNGWCAGMRSFVPAGASGIDSVDLRFYTCASTSAERMRITPGGRVGIGTAAPASALHVRATDQGEARVTIENAANGGRTYQLVAGIPGVGQAGFSLFDTTAGVVRLTIDGDGVMRRAGGLVWDSANDGAGSGLDADLLDGRQGSEFALLSGASFAGPVAAQTPGDGTTGGLRLRGAASSGAAYMQVLDQPGTTQWGYFGFGAGGAVNWTGQQLWHAGSDGAGSGLDADLLDGRQGSEFALLSGASFAGPVAAQTPGDGTTGGLRLRGAASSGAAYMQVLDQPGTTQWGYFGFGAGGAVNWTGQQLWHAGSDGAGSGLDADLLDGWHRDDVRDWNNLLNRPGAFPAAAHTHGAADIAAAFPASLSGNGYTVLPNGLILQWVTGAQQAAGSEGSQGVTFPIAFNSCFQVIVSTQVANVNTESHATYQLIGFSNESATVMRQLVSSAGSDREASWPRLFAIGR